MEDLRDKIEEQLKEINGLLDKSKRNLEKLKEVPDHLITVSKSNGCDQYRLKDKKHKTVRYIKTDEINSLRKIAQKRYEKKVNKKLYGIKRNMEEFLNRYDAGSVYNIYDRMSEARKKLVVPIIETEEMFICRWKDEKYDHMPFSETTEFYSGEGVRVRSKTEVLIADILEQYDIPYKYERPLELKGLGRIRPDFTCINKRDRKEYVWEHFGMMDNPVYACKAIEKINAYQLNGYYPGRNLIMTFETSQSPVNSKSIRSIIEQYLT